MNLFNVCTNVVVVGKINRSSSSMTGHTRASTTNTQGSMMGHSRVSITNTQGSMMGHQAFMQRPIHPSYGQVKQNVDG